MRSSVATVLSEAVERDAVDRLLADLAAWQAGQRTEDAARARSRERSLRLQAEEDATLAGLLLDAAERAEPVVVMTQGGRTHRGLVVNVGADFVAVRGVSGGRLAFVALAAVGAVRAGGPTATGARPPGATRLVDVLARLVDDHPRVQIVTAGEVLNGDLVAVGHDVATLRLDNAEPPLAYVALASVSEVSLPESG
jgi:hypothetical protein